MSGLWVRDASDDELADWDAHTVDVAGGSVHQSTAWARYQQAYGWTPRFLVTGDRRRVLALERRWPVTGGGEAYLPRGPVAGGDAAAAVADRARAVSDFLARGGIDGVVSDAEIEASTGYGTLMCARGFDQADEVQPSRHRLRIPLGAGVDRPSCFANLSMSARQRVRGAIKAGVLVNRLDESSSGTSVGAAVDRLYDLLADTGNRRGFEVVSRDRFGAWATAAVGARLAELFTAVAPDGDVLAAGLFHRHGARLTYFFGADAASARRVFPGVMHLLLWRALEHAVDAGLDELDLGGVDVRGARNRPAPTDPMYGLLAFKESLGGRWVELAGSQRRVMHPVRFGIGRAVSQLEGRVHRREAPVRRVATG